jgi:hypothetical protein
MGVTEHRTMIKKNGMLPKVQLKHEDEIQDIQKKIQEQTSKTVESLRLAQSKIEELFSLDDEVQE